MEYHVMGCNDSGYRLARNGHFTYTASDWRTFRTEPGAKRAAERFDNAHVISFNDEADNMAANNKTYRDGLQELLEYVSLPKFYNSDNMVNVSDIVQRITAIRSEIV